MRILKFAIIGAAVAYGISEIIKRRADGTSLLDDVAVSASDLVEKAADYASKTIETVSQKVKETIA
jgi:hypothetical protein